MISALPLGALLGSVMNAANFWLASSGTSSAHSVSRRVFGVHDKTALYVSMTLVLVLLSIAVGVIASRVVRAGVIVGGSQSGPVPADARTRRGLRR